MYRIKLFCFLFPILILLMLTSCKAPDPTLDESFNAELSITYNNTEYTADLSRKPGELCVTVTSPDDLAGITYTYIGDELTVSCAELSCITADGLPSSSVIQLIYDGITNAPNGSYRSTTDGADLFNVPTNRGAAELAISSGAPVSINADYCPYKISFKYSVEQQTGPG